MTVRTFCPANALEQKYSRATRSRAAVQLARLAVVVMFELRPDERVFVIAQVVDDVIPRAAANSIPPR